MYKCLISLFFFSMVPTDDDIAALPHFRRDQLVLCKFLGSGAFGEVFEGVAKNIINENSGDTKVAVKVSTFLCLLTFHKKILPPIMVIM